MICEECKKDLPISEFKFKTRKPNVRSLICIDCLDNHTLTEVDIIKLNEYSKRITARNAYVLQRI